MCECLTGQELGIAETSLIKVIAQAGGKSVSYIRTELQNTGDLGIIAERAKNTQPRMRPPPPLTIESVFTKLREISKMSGPSVIHYIYCNYMEIKF